MTGSPDPEPIPAELADTATSQGAAAFAEALAFGETAEPAVGPSVPRLANLRDLGGWRTSEGRTVKRGQVFRSVATNRLEADGLAALDGLGVRTVYDLRTEAERAAAPDRVPDGVQVVALDVLADAEQAAPAHLTELFADPSMVSSALGDGRAEELFVSSYRSFVTLPSAQSAYRTLFSGLATAPRRPALFHCTTGKDRTGWAAAALLTWLGVSADDVLTEYLRTNDLLRPALQPVYDRFGEAGGDLEILDAILGVREPYLTAALDELHAAYGSIDAYFSTGLGLSPQVQRQLREGLLEG